MIFKTDENVPRAIVEILRRRNYDAYSVGEQHLNGFPDDEVARICRSEDRIIITLDLDFSDIRTYSPSDYSGIIVLRPHHQAITCLESMVDRVLDALKSQTINGRLWIVDDYRIRMRA